MPAWEEKLKSLITPTTNEWSYRVVQIKPNRKNDSEIYTLSGREEDIAANGSLLLALHDLAERDRINFEQWFKQWESGFVTFDQNRGENFALSGESQWQRIKEPSTRPRYKEWTTPQQRVDGGYRVVEYWSDRSVESESIVVSGTDLQLIQQIMQYENGTRGAAKNDQMWLGYPYQEYLYHHSSSLMLQVHMRLTKAPPWEPNSLVSSLKLSTATLPRPYTQIPNVRPGVTWEAVREAAGGVNGYEWGSFYAVARMGEDLAEKIGRGNQIKCYANSQAEAIRRVESFASLSNSRILTITAGQEQQNKGQRVADNNFRKNTVRIYPAWFIVINDRLVRDANGYGGHGKSTAAGKKLKSQGRIDLWRKPPNVEQTIANLTSRNI
jgi:hypothetical protein